MFSPETPSWPRPPERMTSGKVTLCFFHIIPGDSARGFVPAYHFRILVGETDVGYINLRVGLTDHVRLTAGHVGYEIAEAYRGHHYALAACQALAPFARTIGREWLITCDPENQASRRTIELLGATFLDEMPVPPHDPHYERGSRNKRRYRWTV